MQSIESYEEERLNTARRKSVLLADDEMLIRWSMFQSLSKEGFSVTLAKDGNQVEDLINHDHFDIYIFDLRMPGRDVFSLCEEILEKDDDQQIILMTAFGSEEVQKHAMDMGITYIQKPVDMSQILEILN